MGSATTDKRPSVAPSASWGSSKKGDQRRNLGNLSRKLKDDRDKSKSKDEKDSLLNAVRSLTVPHSGVTVQRKLRRTCHVVLAVVRMKILSKIKLTPTELAILKDVYDKSGGPNSTLRIRELLAQCGQSLTDGELHELLAKVNYQEGFVIKLKGFTQLMMALKRQHVAQQQDTDTGDAFVALGGNRDKTGEISANQLRNVVRYFDLTIDIDKLISEVDSNSSGLIEFREFSGMFEALAGDPMLHSTYRDLAKKETMVDLSADAIVGGWWKVGYQVRESKAAPLVRPDESQHSSLCSEEDRLPIDDQPALSMTDHSPMSLEGKTRRKLKGKKSLGASLPGAGFKGPSEVDTPSAVDLLNKANFGSNHKMKKALVAVLGIHRAQAFINQGLGTGSGAPKRLPHSPPHPHLRAADRPGQSPVGQARSPSPGPRLTNPQPCVDPEHSYYQADYTAEEKLARWTL
mmetsp:Transcript_119474/g.208013  ORF Transcript_119474/g.208013 Transcript_119474/m.208013 type:complete len:460 (-) Transcript_119474:474-1853(-)